MDLRLMQAGGVFRQAEGSGSSHGIYQFVQKFLDFPGDHHPDHGVDVCL